MLSAKCNIAFVCVCAVSCLFFFLHFKKKLGTWPAKSQKQSNANVQVMLRFLGVRTVSQGICLVGMILCLCLPASLVADTKLCPLGDAGGVANATCNVSDKETTCAIFDGRQQKCIGWAYNRCAAREYRDMKTCLCASCPVGSGQSCFPNSECCSLQDCGTAATSTPNKQFGLSSTSRLAPHAGSYSLLLLWLVSVLWKDHTHQF
jgi:hypothetical protein